MLRLPKPDWNDVHDWLHEHFADIRHLSVDKLQTWRNDASRPQPVLVDIRSASEQAVSRIEGARLARNETEAIEKLDDLPRDTPIVAYCAVGLRSARLARELKKAGFRNVHNLEGSIFAWANRGLPLTDGTGAASSVHPYDEHWGVLLDAGRRADTRTGGK